MNLLFISSMRGAPWGGSESLWVAAAHRARSLNHRVAACVFDWPTPAPQILELRHAGASLITRPLHLSRFDGLIQRYLAKPLWLRALNQFNPDAIILSQGSAYECAGRRSTRPIIDWLTQRPANSGSPTAALQRIPRLINIAQYNDDAHPLRRAVHRRVVALMNRAAVNAFVAERNIDQARRTLAITIPGAKLIRNPVNIVSPAATPPGGPPRPARAYPLPIKLACIARLDIRTKGQDRLIAALASPELRNLPWQLSLAGDGHDRDRLLALINKLDLRSRITLLGQVSDISALWRSHHALVLPSLAEGTPLAMVEAMLLARPCVVTDVGGCAEWVRDDIDGFIAPACPKALPGHSHLIPSLARLLSQPDRLAQLGLSARQRALTLYDPDPAGSLLRFALAQA